MRLKFSQSDPDPAGPPETEPAFRHISESYQVVTSEEVHPDERCTEFVSVTTARYVALSLNECRQAESDFIWGRLRMKNAFAVVKRPIGAVVK